MHVSEVGVRDNDYYSVLKIRTIYDDNGLETKKMVITGIGKDAIVKLNIPGDSVGPVSCLKQNVFRDLKLKDPVLKILPVDKKTLALYCGFTNKTIKIVGNIVIPIQFNNLPKIGLEIAQQKCLLPANNVSLPNMCKPT